MRFFTDWRINLNTYRLRKKMKETTCKSKRKRNQD